VDPIAIPIQTAVDPISSSIQLSVRPISSRIQFALGPVTTVVVTGFQPVTACVQPLRQTFFAVFLSPIGSPIQPGIHPFSLPVQTGAHPFPFALQPGVDPVPFSIQPALDSIALSVQPVLHSLSRVIFLTEHRSRSNSQHQAAQNQCTFSHVSPSCGKVLLFLTHIPHCPLTTEGVFFLKILLDFAARGSVHRTRILIKLIYQYYNLFPYTLHTPHSQNERQSNNFLPCPT
jgi:hypothetical protein